MDRLDAMAVFVGIVEAGSLSAAGRRLGLPLTSVSRRLADLEAHLKTRLVHRSTRRLTLTDAGEAYLAACRRILDEVGEAERAAAGEYRAPHGDLVVTAPIVFGRLHVLPAMADFLTAYPDIRVRLVLADGLMDLLESHVDLAVRIAALPDSGHLALRLGTIRRVVCASPSYCAARGRPAVPADLAGHDCVVSQSMTAGGVWRFGRGADETTVPIRARLVVTTAEAAVDAAVAGLGITRVLSYQVAEATRSGALALLLKDFEPDPWPVSLVHAGQGRIPLKLRACLDFLAPRLRERLAGPAMPAG